MLRNRATALASLVVTLIVLVSLGAALAASISSDLRRIAPFDGAQAWLNSPPLSPASLRGKIVLVDFWEYTCVNCLKTLPYESAWYDRYRRYGFAIVGVHTPEFRFSGEPANVAAAVRRLGIDWPVAIDSRAIIWRRYHNDFWPHEFLVDQAGNVVYDHVGEGDYPDTERQIQGLIKAKAPHARLPAVMDYLPQDSYAKPGAVCYPHTDETYLGAWRGDGALGNSIGYGELGRAVAYADTGRHEDGRVYLQGLWSVTPARQAMALARAGRDDYAALPYHAIEVVAVLAPESGRSVKAYVEQDGRALAREVAGKDVHFAAGRSYVVVDAPRAYELIMNRRFGYHELRLRPVQSGLSIYAFDFESCEIGGSR